MADRAFRLEIFSRGAREGEEFVVHVDAELKGGAIQLSGLEMDRLMERLSVGAYVRASTDATNVRVRSLSEFEEKLNNC